MIKFSLRSSAAKMPLLRLACVVYIVVLFSCVVHGDSCDCEPRCAGNATSTDCPNGRVIAREDCDCCFVCAQQLSEDCDRSRPCDVDFGLVCSNSSGKCEAQTSCSLDTDCKSDQFCLGGACADPCRVLRPCESTLQHAVCVPRDHRPICECAPGYSRNQQNECAPVTSCDHDGKKIIVGKSYYSNNCTLQCKCSEDGSFKCEDFSCPRPLFRIGEVTGDPACHERRDDPRSDECCSVVVCAGIMQMEDDLMKHSSDFGPLFENELDSDIFNGGKNIINKTAALRVADSTDESVTITWSNLNASNLAIQYRQQGAESWQKIEQVPGTVKLTLVNLKPGTTYEIKLNDNSTDPILGTTTGGHGFCVYNGTRYEHDHVIVEGCEKTCRCESSDEVKCNSRCSLPFYRRGTFQLDPMCTEQKTDECCVRVVCAGNSDHDPSRALPKDGMSGEECTFKNQTYSSGQEFFDGCELRCTCGNDSDVLCKPRCTHHDTVTLSSGCILLEDPADSCCKIVQCSAGDNGTEQGTQEVITPFDGCIYKNKTYQKGEKFEEGCETKCACIGNKDFVCRPRCSPVPKHYSPDTCLMLPDPDDHCCSVVRCDVNSEDDETQKETSSESNGNQHTTTAMPTTQSTPTSNSTMTTDGAEGRNRKDDNATLSMEEAMKFLENSSFLHVTSVDVLNSSTVTVRVKMGKALASNLDIHNLTVQASEDKENWVGEDYSHEEVEMEGVDMAAIHIGGLKAGKMYYFRVLTRDARSNVAQVTMPESDLLLDESSPSLPTNDAGVVPGVDCEYKGKKYKRDEEFHDGCAAYCACTKTGVQCATIECPTDFALDVLDPHCVSWEKEPDFVAEPPNCCPNIHCKNNGSCMYAGEMYHNFADIPEKLTGCEQRCYCEFGNVTCHPTCPPVTATPPPNLPCPAHTATLDHLPDDDCCLYWQCPHPQNTGFNGAPLPPKFSGNIHPSTNANEVAVQSLQAVDESSVHIVFSLPSIFVGLHGHVEISFTSDLQNDDVSTWDHQVFSLRDDIITRPTLEYRLTDLKPNTTYKVKVTVIMRDIQNSPSSRVLTVRTAEPATPATTLPPQIPVNPDLSVTAVNSTWVHVTWRKFTDFELQFIDGVQLRYKEVEGKVYAATPLIHRAVTSYTIENLKPSTQYEVGIFFIPFPSQTTELLSEHAIHVTTSAEIDPYGFEIAMDINSIKSTSVELTWTGVPYPEDKYVNIFRAIYQSDSGREDFNSFKLAKRDSTAKTMISDLKPGTRYRIWIEAYLTSGKIKKSNVKDFITKAGQAPPVGSSEQGKLEAQPNATPENGDYYGALVAVAIIAALAIVAILILLMIIVRKQGQAKAAISQRKSESAYDNPTYKTCENDAANGSAKNTQENEQP